MFSQGKSWAGRAGNFRVFERILWTQGQPDLYGKEISSGPETIEELTALPAYKELRLWYSMQPTIIWKSLPFWKFKPVTGWRTLLSPWSAVPSFSWRDSHLRGSCEYRRPQGSRRPRFYGLPNIHKQGVSLMHLVTIILVTTYQLAKYLTGLLGYHISNFPCYANNYMLRTLGSLRIGSQYTMVTFDVVSLFSRMPVREVTRLLTSYFEEYIVRFFHCILTYSRVICGGHYYSNNRRHGCGLSTISCIRQLLCGGYWWVGTLPCGQ
jgi:hypothetical protein